MQQSELNELSREIFDSDIPNVVEATLGSGGTVRGSLSREYIETDDIAGIRSVLLVPSADIELLVVDEPVDIDGVNYFARVIEVRGRSISAIILGR